MFCKYLHSVVLILISISVTNLVQCEVYRLPKNVKPVRYFLTMEPHFNKHLWRPSTYEGSVIIELKVLSSTNNITLHANDLNIDNSSITVVDIKGAEVKLIETFIEKTVETYTILLAKELVKGEYYNLTFGNFQRELRFSEGFFLARYWMKGEDEPRGLAATHFEPTGARKAFPCFDEPAIKARFTVNLIRKPGYVSLSNEDLHMTEDLQDGRFKDTFKETPKMSAFVLAFAVSDFKSTKKLERHRIFARPDTIEDGELDYSLETSVTTLRKLEEFTGINFTISKMDSFAVPRGYFEEHAMENWGLVIYGEEHLRCPNCTYGDVRDLKRITTYIAHEFAHQWFGNLVTPEWWDYLWLSESFAAYFQFYIASLVQPKWRLMDQFLIDMVYKSFEREEPSREGSYPLNYPVKRSGQYPPFHIMYQKGSGLIRMMSHFLSHEVFQRGLQIYLRTNQFSNTVPSDLYKALQEAVDKAGTNNLLGNNSVADILGTWDTLIGFPIVTVTRNYKTGSLIVEQNTNFTTTDFWKIPINYVFSSGSKLEFSKTTADFWLTGKSKTIDGSFSSEGWLIVNKQQTGYYRVNYDRENWERIIEHLKTDKFDSIHVLNRAQLIHDSLYLAHRNIIPVDIPLSLCEYLVREKDYIPFAAFFTGIDNYLDIYQGRVKKDEYEYFQKHPLSNTVSPPVQNGHRQEYKIFRQYLKTLTKPVRDYLGQEQKPEESMLDKLNRIEINRYAHLFQ